MKKDCAGGLLRQPRMLAIMPTLACTATCRDCGSGSHPGRKVKLSPNIIMLAIKEAKELGFANIVFTGGEATLEWNTLLQGLRYSSALGLHPRLVTNAHWAWSPSRAEQLTEEMVKSGLDNINFSTGDEHARFVPLECVLHASKAAMEQGLPVHIMVEYRASRTITKETVLHHPLLESLITKKPKQLSISESPWMPIDPMSSGRYAHGDTIDDTNLASREGCPSILQTYIIEADGRIAACCGLGISDTPELYVGTAGKKGFLRRAIRAAESDFLKIWIHTKGPAKVLDWAGKRDSAISWKGKYAHNCQFCRRIYKDMAVRRIILDHYEEALTDVIEAFWFDEQYYPGRLSSAIC